MLSGSGNQWVEKGKDVYHYARWTINPNLSRSDIDYLEWIKEANPLRAKTVYYGLPGAYEGMVFAEIVHKIKTEFEFKRWDEFTAGVDVGHVSSAMTPSLWALEYNILWKVGEYYHSNKDERNMESIELAQAILKFYQEWRD
jgi:phage terminase large subunit